MSKATRILSERDLDIASYIIKNGGLVVFPTETVYGIGANALVDSAVRGIFIAKNRPSNNPLIVHLSSVDEAQKYAVITDDYYRLADRFIPGPLTVILESKNVVSELVTAGLSTVAVRVPQNNIAQRLIKLSGVPIAAPSANISGRPSATRASHILSELDGRVDAIVDSQSSEIGLESTVVMLSNPPRLLRPGAISLEQLRDILPNIEISSGVKRALNESDVLHSPGLSYRHYAPNARCRLVIGDLLQFQNFIKKLPHSNFYVIGYEEEKNICEKFISIGGYRDTSENARRIFDALRRVDGEELVYIHFQRDLSGISLAIFNRLVRATEFDVMYL